MVNVSCLYTNVNSQYPFCMSSGLKFLLIFLKLVEVIFEILCQIVMDDHQRSDGIPVTRFTLHSIYAQSDTEKLEFEYESGNMNFLANEYASHPELSRQVEVFIRKMNSIPAFTANLTVESFNKRTLS
ncbi:mitotic spindle checkpoint MAD1 [Olea europaea subsp. europaea]|uniref:Mitotic spindle checkpoint MAD1 n=1 Tax=Olea europaea subsp. europaea TaxID=158383 RepID=A0A8S0UKB6_OLEEU|nr:mitotic spindle checkpoint MAD1 [Olea europaea subsp. europaea]